MVTYDDMVGLYGASHVVRCSPMVLAQPDLTSEVKAVLSQVGLPDRALPDFICHLQNDSDVFPLFNPPRQAEHWYSLGRAGLSEICFNARNEEIWQLWATGRYPNRFINSGVMAFVEFQYLFNAMCQQDTGQNDERIRQAAREMEECWLRIDSRALSDPDHYWAAMLTDTKFQLGMPPFDD